MIVVESGILITDVHRLVVFGNIRHAQILHRVLHKPSHDCSVPFGSAQKIRDIEVACVTGGDDIVLGGLVIDRHRRGAALAQREIGT